jgi:hypothetical protein
MGKGVGMYISFRSLVSMIIVSLGAAFWFIVAALSLLMGGWVPPWYAVLMTTAAGMFLFYCGIRHWSRWDFTIMTLKIDNVDRQEITSITPRRNVMSLFILLGVSLVPLLQATPRDIRNTLLLNIYSCLGMICLYFGVCFTHHLIIRLRM